MHSQQGLWSKVSEGTTVLVAVCSQSNHCTHFYCTWAMPEIKINWSCFRYFGYCDPSLRSSNRKRIPLNWGHNSFIDCCQMPPWQPPPYPGRHADWEYFLISHRSKMTDSRAMQGVYFALSSSCNRLGNRFVTYLSPIVGIWRDCCCIVLLLVSNILFRSASQKQFWIDIW